MNRPAPPGTEIIVDDRTLDKGGLEMLRRVVERLEREGRGGSGGRHRRGRRYPNFRSAGGRGRHLRH